MDSALRGQSIAAYLSKRDNQSRLEAAVDERGARRQGVNQRRINIERSARSERNSATSFAYQLALRSRINVSPWFCGPRCVPSIYDANIVRSLSENYSTPQMAANFVVLMGLWYERKRWTDGDECLVRVCSVIPMRYIRKNFNGQSCRDWVTGMVNDSLVCTNGRWAWWGDDNSVYEERIVIGVRCKWNLFVDVRYYARVRVCLIRRIF